MVAFTIPYIAFRSTVMICLGLAFLAIHLACEPFDNRSFFVLDKLETRNLRAFNSALLAQLVLDTIKLLRTEEAIDTTAFPANFLVSTSFRGLIFLGVLVMHFMFLELAVTTMLEEKIVKPNRLLVDYSEMVVGLIKLPPWRNWIARFNKYNTMKYDEEKHVLHFLKTTKEEREFVMMSLGEFLSSKVGVIEEFKPAILDVALRNAVKRIYRHKAKLLKQMEQSYQDRPTTVFGFLLKKASDALKPKTVASSPAFDELDPAWLARFRHDGFTAEELNDVLSVMVAAAEMGTPMLSSTSPQVGAFGAVLQYDDGSPDSVNNTFDSFGKLRKSKDKGVQADPKDLRIVDDGLRSEYIGLVIDKYVDKLLDPKDVSTRKRKRRAQKPEESDHVFPTSAVSESAEYGISATDGEECMLRLPDSEPKVPDLEHKEAHRNDSSSMTATTRGLKLPDPNMDSNLQSRPLTHAVLQLKNVDGGTEITARTESTATSGDSSAPFHKALFSALTPVTAHSHEQKLV
eukprot:gnl/MRDRNA2_/MRDRNA2_165798_c0_seq1.p1 gnl/MRDRNA2_/MRDRNA2_165798_c0~~gnl/MRDRNA2_/MRDRNA2_165798_c0_seq1.p1  ORF type:complete len:552 (+),score=97.72 gnl/MRDRNA2_/MRDRNA2_165798_c0_seq1:111-1658(+)